ncbi:MAG: M50 family metallopeptidase [Fimbriimonadaceae bacterium]
MTLTALFDIRVLVVFLAMITVLVFAHELGHYLFARLFGMGVEEFAVGFGRPLVGTYYRRKYRIPLSPEQADAWERGELEVPIPEGLPKVLEAHSEPGALVRESAGAYLDETTNFTVRALPIGGFVRIRGMTPEERGKETQVPGGFYSKPPLQRLVVLFAGPVFSVLAGLLILIPYLMVVGNAQNGHDPVLEVLPGGRGAIGGLRDGDRVVAVAGKPISDFYQLIQAVRGSAEKPLKIEVERGGKSLSLTVTPRRDKAPSDVIGPNLLPNGQKRIQGKLDVGSVPVHVPLGFGPAATEALATPLLAVEGLASGLIHPAQLKESVGGPVSIVRVTAAATNEGVSQVVFIAAELSISLGIFNLLPIFPLDGGQMLVAFAEMLRRGRRLSMKAQTVVATMGFGAIVMLVVGVLYIDIQRIHTDSAASAPAGAK